MNETKKETKMFWNDVSSDNLESKECWKLDLDNVWGDELFELLT